MEPIGAVACVTALFVTGLAYVFEVVGDDDSSIQANLRHSFNALIKEGIWNNKKMQWPKRNGSYVLDHGKLPLHMPAISNFLSDPAHQCKSFARDLFKLVEEKGRKLHFDKIDCACLKQNYIYWLQQNCNEPYKVFAYHFASMIEHYFGKHKFCKGKKEGGGVSIRTMKQ